MALRNSLLNESGFPGIDEYAGIADSWIKAAYEYGAAFSVDVNFWDESVDELGVITNTPIIIDNFTFVPYDTNVKCVKKNNNTLTISGSIGETFKDSYYQFLMNDKSVKTLPMNTTEKFAAIVKWSPPSTKHVEIVHTLNMTYKLDVTTVQPSITVDKSFQQGIYWNYGIATNQFRGLVSKGTI